MQLSPSTESSESCSTRLTPPMEWRESHSTQKIGAKLDSAEPEGQIRHGDGTVVVVDEDVDSVTWGRVESGKRTIPVRLAWKRRLPSVRSTPLWRASKTRRVAGECGVKQREPKQIGSQDVGES